MKKSIKQRLISGGLWAFSGRILILASGVVINGLLARLLSPEDMGAYFLAFSLVLVLSRLAQFGTLQTVVRLVAESLSSRKLARARSVIRNVFLISGTGTLIVGLLLTSDVGKWLAKDVFNSTTMATHMVLIAVWTALFSMQGVISESFRAFSDIRLATLFDRLVTSLVTLVLLSYVWLVFNSADLELVLDLTIAALACSLLFGGFLLLCRFKKLHKGGGHATNAREILKVSLPLLVVALVPVVLGQGGLWILGANRPPEEVAVFASVLRLVALMSMPLLVVNSVVAPMIAEMYTRGNKVQLEYYLRNTATLAGVAALCIIFVFIAFGDMILALIYGDFYKVGHTTLVIICLGTLVNVWSGSCGLTLVMTGGERTVMCITVASGILLMVGAILTVDRFGTVGVAAITAISTALQYMLLVIYARKRTGMWTHMMWWPSFSEQRSNQKR